MQNPSINYNPDVLSCLANLSNDEVFTSPALANQMLDLLPQELFCSSKTTFLDPAAKSGVFLREIAKRLLTGLKDEIPDLQTRINHILTEQIFGLGLTELTALLSRRTLYCSREADGKYSVCEAFADPQGHIFYMPLKHQWENGRCTKCGASRQVYDRGDELESHAYAFIHQDLKQISEKLPVKFDVIIGNPPYQLSDGGAQASAKPIYDQFVEQAIKLQPKYLSMIIPARWYAGGKGLDNFRNRMLNDERFSVLHDYPDSTDCFAGVSIKGGVCYFLWEEQRKGDCLVITHEKDKVISEMKRPLKEDGIDTFIRYNNAIEILSKVKSKQEESFSKLVSSRKPFNLATNVRGRTMPLKNQMPHNIVKLYQNGGTGYLSREEILINKQWIGNHKVYIGRAYGAGETFPHQILNYPIYGEPNSACTETYLVIGPFDSKEICENVMSYIQTRFFRFLVLLIKNTQDAPKKVYELVPMQNFSKPWTDKELYEKYGLSEAEIEFIESMIRPMNNE